MCPVMIKYLNLNKNMDFSKLKKPAKRNQSLNFQTKMSDEERVEAHRNAQKRSTDAVSAKKE